MHLAVVLQPIFPKSMSFDEFYARMAAGAEKKHHKLMQMGLKDISDLFRSRDLMSFMCVDHQELLE